MDMEATLGKHIILKGGQQLGKKQKGVYDKVAFPRALHLPWPAKRHLRTAGDGHKLQPLQVHCSGQPKV